MRGSDGMGKVAFGERRDLGLWSVLLCHSGEVWRIGFRQTDKVLDFGSTECIRYNEACLAVHRRDDDYIFYLNSREQLPLLVSHCSVLHQRAYILEDERGHGGIR